MSFKSNKDSSISGNFCLQKMHVERLWGKVFGKKVQESGISIILYVCTVMGETVYILMPNLLYIDSGFVCLNLHGE